MRKMLSNIDPQLASFVTSEGGLDLGALAPPSDDWNPMDKDEASLALLETIKNNQEKKSGETEKFGAPDLPPKPTNPPTPPPTQPVTTPKPTITRPVVSSHDAYKKQLVEQQLMTFRQSLIRNGVKDPTLANMVTEKRGMLERQFGISSDTNSFLNKHEERDLKLENYRKVLIQQGYRGTLLDLEMQKYKLQLDASLGINSITTTTRRTTTTRTTTTTKARVKIYKLLSIENFSKKVSKI